MKLFSRNWAHKSSRLGTAILRTGTKRKEPRTPDSVLSQIAIIQYDKKPVLGFENIGLSKSGELSTSSIGVQSHDNGDQPELCRFGQQAYVDQNVLATDGAGYPFIRADLEKLMRVKTVGDVVPKDAIRLAARIIQATEESIKVVPLPGSAIGGKPLILFIDGKNEPKPIEPPPFQ